MNRSDVNKITARAVAVLETLGGELVDPPAILPADIPLELSGEAVRARLCVFSDTSGAERVMRPDLTLPIAAREANARASGAGCVSVYRYAARAFRLPSTPGDPMEFMQVGFEKFGAPAAPDTDAELFQIVGEAAAEAGGKIARVSMGDLSVFPAFVDALGLADVTAGLLKRAFRTHGGVRALLAQAPDQAERDLAEKLADPDERADILASELQTRGIEHVGLRSLEEIAAGLVAKADAATLGGVPDEARDVLEHVLDVTAAPDAAAGALSALARDASLDAAMPCLDRLAARNDKMQAAAPELMACAVFQTPFGRRFNYYDGFVFEMFGAGADAAHPLGAGGRYDRLVFDLSSGAANVTAVGGVVRPDRVALSMEAQG